MTVNRVCGSGAQAVISAAQDIQLGIARVSLAGGRENMDQAPYLMPGSRWGYRMGHRQIVDAARLPLARARTADHRHASAEHAEKHAMVRERASRHVLAALGFRGRTAIDDQAGAPGHR